jgi:hypothetical protein
MRGIIGEDPNPLKTGVINPILVYEHKIISDPHN